MITVFLSGNCFAQDPGKTELPVKYVEGRYFVTPVTKTADTLEFYLDSAGGTNMIWQGVVDELGLETRKKNLRNRNFSVTSMPEFKKGSAIPAAKKLTPLGSELIVRNPKKQNKYAETGFLGNIWFGGRVWEFDYPNKSLSVLQNSDYKKDPDMNWVDIGIPTDSTGRAVNFFPSITVVVDGDSIDMLFDTGGYLVSV